jgi:CubicO group peptidase (beta-lactamase class C family)
MPEVDQLELSARFSRILSRWPAVGLAVGAVRNGGLEFFHGHGFADIASKTPVAEDTVFRIGSITKTFTAIAVMQLWEQQLIDLDAPANDYLRGYRLIPAKTTHRPATLRHLLTHTAGLPEVVYPSRMLQPQCSSPRPLPRCTPPSTSRIPECRVSGWRSPGSTWVGISRSSTEGSFPGSTPKSSLPR